MIIWNVLALLVLLSSWCSAAKHKLLIFLEDSNTNLESIIDKVPKEPEVDVDMVTMKYNVQQTFLDEVCKRSRPDLILDLTTWKIASETAKKITRYARIPTITTTFGGEGDFIEWMDLSAAHKDIFLQIKQPADLVPHVVRAIVKRHKYANAAVLYDNTFVMLHKLKMLLINMEVRHTILPHNRVFLAELHRLEIFNYFIIGTANTISKILTGACKSGFFKRNFAWYAITLEERGNVHVDCSYSRFVVASPKLKRRNLKVDFGNPEGDALPRVTKEFYYDVVRIAYGVVKNVKKSSLKELCDDGINEGANVKMVSSVNTTIQANAKELISDKYHINDLWTSFAHVDMELKGYTFGENGTTKEHIADWNYENIPLLTNVGNLDKYASKIIYRISVAVQEPFLFPDEYSPYNYSGFCIDLIEDIAERVGFKFELYSPEGSGFRYDFDATIKEVQQERAAIGLGPISVSYERASRVDFTIPFYELVGMLIMMKIPESSKSFFKIIEVLDVGVWAMLLLFFFITSFMVWIFDKFSPYSYQNNRELLAESEEKREFTLRECFWFCLTSVTSQGGGEAPRPLSGKIVTGTWWFFGFLIVASYTANLAAFLTVSHLESSIESLEDLSRQYKVKYGVIKGSTGMNYFKTLSQAEKSLFERRLRDLYPTRSKKRTDQALFTGDFPVDNMFSKMLKFMIDTKAMPDSLEEAIGKVQNATPSENYAYIGDATDIKFAAITNCDLQAIGDEFAKKFYSLAVKRNSPLKEPLDNALMELLNERKLERIKNKWWRENEKIVECGNRRHQTDGITIQNVVGVFLLIGGGVVISLIIMGLDDMYAKRMARLRLAPPAVK